MEPEDYESLPVGVSTTSHMLAGSCAGILEHCILYPVDCVKTRLQCLRPAGGRQYLSLTDGLYQMARHEGFLRSFRGIGAVVCGAGPAHAFYFALYEHLKKVLESPDRPDSTYNHLAHAASGACATVVHDAVMTPADAIKQRLQMFKSPYHNTLDCFRRVCQTKGPAVLYRAYFTQLSTNVPFQAVHFMVYEFLQQKLNPEKTYRPWTHIVSGGLAGSFAAAITTPMDVCKTVLNTQESAAVRALQHNSSIHPKKDIRGLFGSARLIISSQGPRGLFLGMNARIVATLPGTAISWAVYEYFKWYLTNRNQSNGASLSSCVAPSFHDDSSAPTIVAMESIENSINSNHFQGGDA